MQFCVIEWDVHKITNDLRLFFISWWVPRLLQHWDIWEIFSLNHFHLLARYTFQSIMPKCSVWKVISIQCTLHWNELHVDLSKWLRWAPREIVFKMCWRKCVLLRYLKIMWTQDVMVFNKALWMQAKYIKSLIWFISVHRWRESATPCNFIID